MPAVAPELRTQAVFSFDEYATETGVWPRVGRGFPTGFRCSGSLLLIVKREKVSSPALTLKRYYVPSLIF